MKIEYEVVALVAQREQHTDAQLDRSRRDLDLGEHAFLISSQHGQHISRSVGCNVAHLGDMSS